MVETKSRERRKTKKEGSGKGRKIEEKNWKRTEKLPHASQKLLAAKFVSADDRSKLSYFLIRVLDIVDLCETERPY